MPAAGTMADVYTLPSTFLRSTQFVSDRLSLLQLHQLKVKGTRNYTAGELADDSVLNPVFTRLQNMIIPPLAHSNDLFFSALWWIISNAIVFTVEGYHSHVQKSIYHTLYTHSPTQCYYLCLDAVKLNTLNYTFYTAFQQMEPVSMQKDIIP